MQGALIKVIASLLCAGIFYLIWMAVFLLFAKLENLIVETVLWLLAPVITALGFTVGIMIVERLTRSRRKDFISLYVWPLTGCAIGAIVVYWFGPMLIVFSMFGAGMMSVILREIIKFHKEKQT